MDNLKLTPRKLQMGCGIYEAGDTDKCYVKLFVTDTGRVIPVNHRVLSEDDLMNAYSWGLQDARAAVGLPDPADEDEPYEIEPVSEKQTVPVDEPATEEIPF